ncbi:MAG: hypothetical protein M5R42_06200 [Rhodocyclaceae bacterium]|nr:hypothetical protein [Rhodocyclaceae bacterium]
MQRWNDKDPSVEELIELDEAVHKMVVAWFLRAGRGGSPERHLTGPGSSRRIFELFQRIVITDLKPQIFLQDQGRHEKYRQLNEWVCGSCG